MNEDRKKRGITHSKFLTALTITALFLGSGEAMANKNIQNSSYTANEQQQSQAVQGLIVDSKGEAIIGASVLEKRTTNGTISDINGKFSLNVKPGTILIVSYIGYKSQEVKASKNMQVVLKEDTELLDEVVVVGYGAQKKVNLTGAVSNINVQEAIASRPVTDAAKALQGISPGLTITNKVGGIGTESTIKLRGSVGSLSATNGTSPLILVDNVEIPSINLVNPDDIETISVLKDAASASIYGTRAAWGVILITTKQGKKNDKVKVNYSNNYAWSTPTTMAELASASDNAEFIMTILDRLGQNSITNIGYTIDATAVEKIKGWEEQYGNMSQSELGEMLEGRDFEIRGGKTFFYRSFDPIKEFTKDWTPQQNHNLSVTGGNDKTTYNIGLGYLNQTGVMKFNSDKYNRYTLNSNITTNIRDWWKVKANILFTRSENDQPYKYTSGQYDAWFYLMRWPRWYPYAQYDGKDFRSAVTDIKSGNRESVTSNYIRTNLGTEITPIKDLTINFDYTFSMLIDAQKRNGGTVMAYNMFSSAPFSNYADIYGSTHNRVTQSSKYTMANIFKAYATYNLNFEKKHNFKIMAGMDAESREKLSHYSERRGLISTTLPEIALATGDQYSYSSTDSYHNDFAAAGFFGRINYNYMQKYLLEINARYDGSSNFPKGKKWALFPSVSAGWRTSEESFMTWVKPTLSTLKVRGSWGTIGNQDVASNSFISTMTSGNSNWVVNGTNQLYLGSPSVISSALTWERVTTTDLGLDARFFNDELGFTFDWYKRVTSDMHCAGETLPSTFGASSPKINYGEITGNGLELGLDYSHRFKSGFGINARASISHVTEKITKFKGSNNNIYGNYEGKRLGEIWGYETDRLFQESDFKIDGSLKDGIASQSLYETGSFKFGPGDVKYKNIDGDDKISYGKNTIEDHGDLKVIGNTLPDYEYSFSLGADYKGLDLSVFFQGVGKRDYWAYGSVAIPAGGSSYADAAYAHQMDYWTTTNTNAYYPRPSNNAWVSNGQNFLRQTRYLSDMSYLRCKNITIGYTLPQEWLKKIRFENARFYVSAENLFEFDNMKIPVDPESTDYKTGYGDGSYAFGRSYPYQRTISLGMQIGF
ncbi:SusC/RagA family TonB-linked outer membrane protein [Bacteroides ihuae]|uniref:SusC/RagA family TonB-linked outer membrane protein n=1 Tax=Bacteroides ihuae TaxID=1852362 RepID=UPI0008DAEA39|nr:TonB-dependent receptor [Bacteroides ihuae]